VYIENKLYINNIWDYIALQITLKRGYFILTVVKLIKYSKERSVRPFKAILKAFK